MANLLQFRLDLDGIAAIPPSVRRDTFRFAIGEAGGAWWKNYLPDHFTNVAYARYSYGRRKDGYERAKRLRRKNGQDRRAIGEVKPLVWTGESRERATKTKDVRARAASHTRYYADVIMNANALNFKNPKSAIDMRAEVTRVTSTERGKLQGVFQLAAIKRFKELGHNHKLTKIIKSA